jgi:hypothetical protein
MYSRKDNVARWVGLTAVFPEHRRFRVLHEEEWYYGEEESNHRTLEDSRAGGGRLRKDSTASTVYRVYPLLFQRPEVLVIFNATPSVHVRFLEKRVKSYILPQSQIPCQGN